VSSPGLPNPQNSPEESGQPPSSSLQTPPVTSFFTPFSSRIERIVQQIISPNKENFERTSKEGEGSETLSGVELRNLSNIGEPLENLSFLEGTSIRNLFPHSSPLTPFGSQFFTSGGIHDIGRPIEESLTSPINRFLLTSTPHNIRQLNELNFGRSGNGSNEGLLLLEKLQRERLQSSEIVLSLQDVQNNEPENQNLGDGSISHKAHTLSSFGTSLSPILTSGSREGNEERRVIATSSKGAPSGSSLSSSNPSTPPSPPIHNLENLEAMAQPQRLLNIAPFPYFYGRPGDDPDVYVDRFQTVAIANELPLNKYLTSFPGNLVGNAREWYATLNPRPPDWEGLRDAFLARFRPQAFQSSLMDQLGYLQMGPNEDVDAYYSHLRSLLHKWHNHGMPPEYLKNQFIKGLLNPECIVMVNMASPATLEEAYNTAKRWEESTMRAHYGYNYR
jgi:hypothetical protein